MSNGLEVADVMRDGCYAFLSRYGHTLSREQRGVLRDVMDCRTPAMGGHREQCDQCGHERLHYNSCGNRHCPKCQALARAQWMEARCTELLPIPYFHVVFTLPSELAPLALQNQRLLYGILFQAAAETLQTVAANPEHLGAQIGILAVLHTWGQNLMHHPHVHCIVTGGGLSPDRSAWVDCRRSGRHKKAFFLPVRILSRVFRGKFIHLLKRAYHKGSLHFHGKLTRLESPEAFENLLNQSVRKDWVVYAKRPFGGPEQVLKYLARYTHRVAISNARLVDLQNGRVCFRYKDYAQGQETKILSLSSCEFIRRFLMHTLPSGFVRIRYYGFLANRFRQERLNQCRVLLEMKAQPVAPPQRESAQTELFEVPRQYQRCPVCGCGTLVIVETFSAVQPLRPPFFLRRTPHTAPHAHDLSRAPP